jgi:TRAP-type C4-dicarboxylate transport system substrate-binding protein
MMGLNKPCVALALAGSLLLGVPALAVDWDLATANAPGNYQTKLAEKFAADVAAATNNEVKITVHAGGQLGFKGPEMLGAVRDGLVPIGSFQFAQQVGLSPLLGASSLPYLVSGFDEMKTFRTVSKPYFDAEFKKFNQKLLYEVPWPGQNIFSKTEIANPGTFTTMKIRTPDRAGSEFFRSLGASPAQIPFGEVVPALATGVIDSVTTSTSSAIDGQFWEFLKLVTVVNWQTNFEGITVNLDAWNKLTPQNQKIIEELAEKLEPSFWEVAKAEDSRNFETLKAKGMQVNTPAASVRDAMVAKGKPSWAAFQETVPAAKPLFEKYLTAVGK